VGLVQRASVRTCVGCRRRGPASDMLRLTIDAAGTIRADAHRKGSGRGASMHRDASCVEAAQRPGVLARAFKRAVQQGAALTISQSSAVSHR